MEASVESVGVYLTDGENLYVIAAVWGTVAMLEDCVSGELTRWPVKDLITARFRKVTPARD